MSTTTQPVELHHVIEKEQQLISSKRKQCRAQNDHEHPEQNLFGIALSGGGIRSATTNLGVLEIFNTLGILSQADYLSTVSGGGYIGGYIHAKLWQENSYNRETGKYGRLFEPVDIKHLKQYGKYLIPGEGLMKLFHAFRFAGAMAFSLLLNGIWSIFFFLFLFYGLLLISKGLFGIPIFSEILWGSTIIVVMVHFFLHDLRNMNVSGWKLWSSNTLHTIEGGLMVGIAAYLLSLLDKPYVFNIFLGEDMTLLGNCIMAGFLFVLTGFFSDPNTLSLHRFYRDRLAEAYVKGTGYMKNEPLTLVELNRNPKGESRAWTAPYPLINNCLNLHGETDDSFQGTRTYDFFLLSPLFCGSKLTGYTSTHSAAYRKMTLPTAMAISGAAVNPEMGHYSNQIVTFLMALLNFKMGYWAVNPKMTQEKKRTEWWPKYLLAELFSRTDTRKARVNISDGGHIENLGVYELLRRRCKLIISIDASTDAEYQFSNLKNLVIRARNELELDITFLEYPEMLIRPYPSKGFSDAHVVIGHIAELPEKEGGQGKPVGLLVYIKSSLKGAVLKKQKDAIKKQPYGDGYFYKTYHPAFPHESTADQFFDHAQWEAYYHLGRFIAADICRAAGIVDHHVTLEQILHEEVITPCVKTIDGLYEAFAHCTLEEQTDSRSF